VESTILAKARRRFQVPWLAKPVEASLPDPVENHMPKPWPRRRWYRLHVSTWTVMLLMSALMTLIEVPGEVVSDGGNYMGEMKFTHGWPSVYFERQWAIPPTSPYFLSGDDDSVKAPWRCSCAWTFYEYSRPPKFSLPNFLLDLSLTMVIVLAAGGLFEWRRRKRTRLIQFTLRELLLAMLLTAGAFSWWRTEHNRRINEQSVFNQYGLDRYLSDNKYVGPVLLKKLLGLENLDDLYRYGTCMMFEPKPKDVEKCLPLLKNFRCLESLTVHRAINIGDEQIAEISELKSLEELYLCDAKITNASCETISRFGNLRKLTIANAKLADESIPPLARLSGLNTLDLSGTRITDESIPRLGRLTQLKTLDVSGTCITSAGSRELKSRLPQCVVLHAGIVPLWDETSNAIRRATKKKP
jgi:hypothetical protein